MSPEGNPRLAAAREHRYSFFRLLVLQQRYVIVRGLGFCCGDLRARLLSPAISEERVHRRPLRCRPRTSFQSSGKGAAEVLEEDAQPLGGVDGHDSLDDDVDVQFELRVP